MFSPCVYGQDEHALAGNKVIYSHNGKLSFKSSNFIQNCNINMSSVLFKSKFVCFFILFIWFVTVFLFINNIFPVSEIFWLLNKKTFRVLINSSSNFLISFSTSFT